MWNVQAGLLSVAAINAIYNVVAQVIGRSSLDPVVFSTYRDFAAAPILFVLALPGVVDRYVGQGPAGQTAAGRGLWPKTRSDLFRMALQGALGVYANQILFLFGVELTDATTGSVCNLTLPVFAAAIGMCTGRESFRWQTILGLCFCLAGALLMKLEAGPREGGSVLGVLLLLAGSFCSAVYYIIQKETLRRYPAVLVTSWEYLFGFALMALSAAILADRRPQSWVLTNASIVMLAFTVLFNSVAKYLLNSICNKYVSATVLTCWSTVVPVFTAGLSFVFLSQPLRVSYLGSLPVLLGVFLVMRAREDSRKEPGFAKLQELEPC